MDGTWRFSIFRRFGFEYGWKGIVGRGRALSERVGMEVVRKSIVNCAVGVVVGDEESVGRRASTENNVSGAS